MPARDINNKIIFGVCAGLSEYYNVDVVIMRVIFLIGFLFMGITLVIYLILALIMPIDTSVNFKNEKSPLQILKERLARGEITKEQFKEMKEILDS